MGSGMLWIEDEDEHEYVHDYEDAGTQRDRAHLLLENSVRASASGSVRASVSASDSVRASASASGSASASAGVSVGVRAGCYRPSRACMRLSR